MQASLKVHRLGYYSPRDLLYFDNFKCSWATWPPLSILRFAPLSPWIVARSDWPQSKNHSKGIIYKHPDFWPALAGDDSFIVTLVVWCFEDKLEHVLRLLITKTYLQLQPSFASKFSLWIININGPYVCHIDIGGRLLIHIHWIVFLFRGDLLKYKCIRQWNWSTLVLLW